MENKINNDVFYIIIGCMYLKKDEEYLKQNYLKDSTSVSNNVFERKLFHGFQTNDEIKDFVFVSAPSVGWYPKNCKKIRMSGFSRVENYIPVSYLTTYIGSTFSKAKAIKKTLKKIIAVNNLRKRKVCVLLNELHLPYLESARFIKKIIPTSTIIQFVPDLPEFNNRSNNRLYKFLKRLNCKKINTLRTKYIDKYILFSQPMASYLNIEDNNNWIVNHGIVAEDKENVEPYFVDNKKHIVFIGKIDKRNGIDLILAVAALFANNENIAFDLFGIGASDAISKDVFASHSNVVCHGFINPSMVKGVLTSSTVLLSPRYSDEEYTKYSFPSKMFEYLSSYKPIVTFKLDCYPNELDDLVIYPKEMTDKGLFEAIDNAINNYNVNRDKIDDFLAKYTERELVKKIINLGN